MSEPTVTPEQLRSPRWRETVHERITPVQIAVDPLAEEAGREVGRRYQEEGTSARLPRELVADVVNRLNGRDLPESVRWLLAQRFVVVRALERAQSEGTLDEEDPARSVLDFIDDDTVPRFIDVLVEVATRPDVLEPMVRDLGLEPGEIRREDLVHRLRDRGLEIREGRCREVIAEALGQARDAGGPDVAASAPTMTPTGAPGAASTSRPAAETVSVDEDWAAREGRERHRPPDLWGVDCDPDLPVKPVESRPRGDLIVLARTISFLYVMGERQPLFAAVEALRQRMLSSDLLNPLGRRDPEKGGTDDDLCDLRMWLYDWNRGCDPLTLEERADVAAAIGIRDPAATAVVNAGFARAVDRLVDVLIAVATGRRRYTLDWARPAAEDISVQIAGWFQRALTGQVMVQVALWRRQFRLASHVLGHRTLRSLLGVGFDPDRSPAPVIRMVLPGTPFDAAGLFREWRALDQVLELAGRLAVDEYLSDAEFSAYAAAAVTLRAQKGRLRVPGLETAGR
jgi:hypothetical protein